MTLHTRVAVLEKDVATLRSRMDNADVERDDINRQIADARAETRGWAEIALRTDQKMDAAAELMTLIFADVRQTKETLADHSAILKDHSTILKEHSTILKEHSTILKEHSTILKEHGELLRQILAKLA
jgi:hypothetical protein